MARYKVKVGLFDQKNPAARAPGFSRGEIQLMGDGSSRFRAVDVVLSVSCKIAIPRIAERQAADMFRRLGDLVVWRERFAAWLIFGV